MNIKKHAKLAKMIVSKLPNVGISIFAEMSAMAMQYNAINLGQGFPEFAGDSVLYDLVYAYMQKGMNQYAPMAGLLTLREAIAKKYHQNYQVMYNADTEITITAGGTQALFTAMACILRPNEEVILFDPAYDSYAPSIESFGAKAIHISMLAPDFTIDWGKVEEKINSNTKAIVFNNPHNPCGKVFSSYDVEQLAIIAEKYNLLIISDEVYEHIVFDDKKMISVGQNEILRNRSFIVYSFGKTLHNTGWKIGYCMAVEPLMREFRKVHQFNVFSVNTPFQYALADYFDTHKDFSALGNLFQRKRDLFATMLQGSRFKVLQSEGTYFALVDYSAISNEPDIAFSKKIIEENGVASIPISVFYKEKIDQKLLRFCFAKHDETILKACEKLNEL